MFSKKPKIKTQTVQFEHDDRLVDVKIEFDAKSPPIKYGWMLLLLKIVMFPILLPFKVFWFFLRNIIND